MKVVCCLFKYFPYGGLSKDLKKIVNALKNKGHTVYIFAQEWEGELIDGVCTEVFGKKGKTNHEKVKRYCEDLKIALNERHKDTDFVIGFNKMPYLDFYYAADVCYVKTIDANKKGLTKFLYKLTPRYRFFREMENYVFSNSSKTKVLFLDKIQKKHYESIYGLMDKKCVILPPGLDKTCKVQNIKKASREDKITVIQIGSDFKRKGLARSIRAIGSLPNELKSKIEFVVVGQDESKPYLKLAMQQGIVRENIKFTGGIKKTNAWLASADILLHPALIENTGTVILEAIAMEIPCIVTESCGFSHYVFEANTGVVLKSPFKQEELNKELKKMIINKEQRDLYKSNARKFNKECDLYSMPDVVVKILEEELRKKNDKNNSIDACL